MAIFKNSPPIVTDGLVLYLDAANTKSYPTTGTTWNDLVGLNNGTLTNGPTFSSDNGGSILCDGVNDYINLGVNYRYQDSFTIECWVKWPNTQTQGSGSACGIYGPIFTNKDYGWNLSTNNNNFIMWEVYNTSAAFKQVQTTQSYLNQWVHITAYKNGTEIGLYVNGVLIGKNTLTSNAVYYFSNYACTLAGNHPCGPITYYFLMYAAIAKIYNRALTASEILQNYNATKQRYNLT
jgi:hypothetical protein